MVTIRPAEPRDATGLWRVEIETADATFRGMMSDAAYHRWRAKARRSNSWPATLRDSSNITYVAEEGGVIVGYAMGGRARPLPIGWDGELFLLYVLPSYQRMGIGRALVLAIGRRLAEVGMRSMSVWSLATNQSSRSFYQALGATFVGHRTLWEWRGRSPIAVYGWRPLFKLFDATGESMPALIVTPPDSLTRQIKIALAVGGTLLMAVASSLTPEFYAFIDKRHPGYFALFAIGLAMFARASRR